MRPFVQTMTFLQQNLAAWLLFSILAFLIDKCSLGLLSLQILRVSKRSYIAQENPSIQEVLNDIPLGKDIKTWVYMFGYSMLFRVGMFLFLWPLYIVCSALWKHVILLGLIAWLGFFLLLILLFAIESIFMLWFQLLVIDGYFDEKTAFLVNWEYLKKRSRPMAVFCLIEAAWCLSPLFFISLPSVMRVIGYEEEREVLLEIAQQANLSMLER